MHEETFVKFAECLLPYTIYNLVKKGKFKGVEMESPAKLFKIFSDNYKECADDLEYPIGVSDSFIKWAQKAHKEGDDFVAVVLATTAIEQEINGCYRYILRKEGLADEEITKIIKKHNVEAKLTWLLKLTTKTELDDNLKKNIKAIFDIRNSIVHYKAVFSKLDQATGSFEKIEHELKKIEEINFLNLYKDLEKELKPLCFINDEEWMSAIKIYQKIISYLKNLKKKKST